MEHHIMATAPVAAGAWFFTHNWFYVVMSVCLGVLVDFDHVFDYIREEGTFDMRGMFVKSYKGDFHHLYVIFHAYEYVPLAWLAGYLMNNYTFSIVFSAAYLAHMIPDQLMNNVRPWGYFLTYRIMKKFVMTDIFYKGRPVEKLKS
jgi:hypothetical protein